MSKTTFVRYCSQNAGNSTSWTQPCKVIRKRHAPDPLKNDEPFHIQASFAILVKHGFFLLVANTLMNQLLLEYNVKVYLYSCYKDINFNVHYNAHEVSRLYTEYYYSNCVTAKYILHCMCSV